MEDIGKKVQMPKTVRTDRCQNHQITASNTMCPTSSQYESRTLLCNAPNDRTQLDISERSHLGLPMLRTYVIYVRPMFYHIWDPFKIALHLQRWHPSFHLR
ncbi:hypothetical protein DPMN_182711 [Dreissena polymorpha]|uniref:Uncharacterized protein n=1 Tax=Dreissena polymorpha TaxID=45954 RepID=A0A9D4DG79_DREPO|nr:hypothetical protein DPMN_182711 [Dreissena polymorpha]